MLNAGQYQAIGSNDDDLREISQGGRLGGIEMGLSQPSDSLLSQRALPDSSSITNLSSVDERENSRDNSTSYERSLLSRSTPNRNIAVPVSKWVTSGFTTLWCSYVLLIIIFSVAFLSLFKFTKELQSQVGLLKNNIMSLETELSSLRLKSSLEIGSLSDDVIRIETNYTRQITGLDGRLISIDNTLSRLTNRTSNADVLDELHKTKYQIQGEMNKAKSDVSTALELTTANVTRKLHENQLKMQQTEISLRNVVHQATSEIQLVQSNVTEQLAVMSRNLESTVEGVRTTVDSAQATIHNEVKMVQDNIEQYVAITNKQFAAEDDFVKYQLAGTFTMLGCLISGYHLTQHLRHYYKPDVQRRIMAVLWMVPIYGITSWLSLVVPKFEAIFGALRDCYEAYAVYTFIALLIAILEDGRGLADLLSTLTKHVIEERNAVEEAVRTRQKRPAEHLRPPFPCCYEWHKPSQVAKAWLYQCRLMAMQFVITKPFFSLVPFFMWMSGFDYDDHPPFVHQQVNWASPKLYIMFLQNLSVAIAFTGLLSFYHGTEKDLAWCDPWPKFLCIKGVVFMTFWQGLVLQGMASLGFVADRQATQIQNLLICIEMLLASLAHFYIFPYYEWEDGYKREKEKSVLLRDTLALRDFVTDMKMMVTRWEGGPAEDKEEGTPEDGRKEGELVSEDSEGAVSEGLPLLRLKSVSGATNDPETTIPGAGAGLSPKVNNRRGTPQKDNERESSERSKLFARELADNGDSGRGAHLEYYQSTRNDTNAPCRTSSPTPFPRSKGEHDYEPALMSRTTLPVRPSVMRSSLGSLVGRPETTIDADIDDLVGIAMESIGQAVSQLELLPAEAEGWVRSSGLGVPVTSAASSTTTSSFAASNFSKRRSKERPSSSTPFAATSAEYEKASSESPTPSAWTTVPDANHLGMLAQSPAGPSAHSALDFSFHGVELLDLATGSDDQAADRYELERTSGAWDAHGEGESGGVSEEEGIFGSEERVLLSSVHSSRQSLDAHPVDSPHPDSPYPGSTVWGSSGSDTPPPLARFALPDDSPKYGCDAEVMDV